MAGIGGRAGIAGIGGAITEGYGWAAAGSDSAATNSDESNMRVVSIVLAGDSC
jgi:hypothetical protein